MSEVSLVLASASPRRKQLLEQIGVKISVLPVDIDESLNPAESPENYVRRMAETKALAGQNRQQGVLPVLGADTAVVLGQRVFGKPKSCDDAIAMLMALSGTTHCVLSGVAIAAKGRCNYKLSETKVTFRTLQEKECLEYWYTGEPADKAGAYAIQGKGAVFVKNLEGSFSGVVGLPLLETSELLGQFNIPCWLPSE